MIRPTKSIRGKVHAAVIKEYPELENIEITPTVDDQTYKSDMYGYDEVKVKGVQSYIDEDIKPEYIVEGVDILGVVGNYKGIDTSDATVTTEDVLSGKIVYINNEKQIGTMSNNGELQYEPSDEEQIIPTGYTSGGIIKATDITNLQEYEECLAISNHILGLSYKQVEYITCNEDNGFDLGIPLWSDNNWTITAEISIDEIRNYQHIFSISDDDNNHETWIASDGYYYVRLAAGNKQKIAALFEVDKKTEIKHRWVTGNCTTYIDGDRKMYTSYGSFTSPLNLRFGKRGTSYFTGNIYSIQLYQGSNNTLVGNFIPVINEITGEATLFNLVTKTYATNLGSKTCIAGPELQEVV